MQCPSCKAEWNLDNSKSRLLIKKCPFCGENLSLKIENEDNKGIGDILRSIVENYGSTIYAIESAQRLKALLADLAFDFPKEQKLLNLAISEQIPARFLAISEKTDDEKQNIMFYCKKNLVEDYSIDESVAIALVNMLAYSLGWKIVIYAKKQAYEMERNVINKKDTQIENEIVHKLLVAAEQGDSEAQEQLGYEYLKGENIVQNYQKAVYWFKRSALQGNMYAQGYLGYMHRYGKGVETDYEQAYYWFIAAAKQGHDLAQVELAYMYLDGEGVAQDYYKAFEFFEAAAQRGNKNAQDFLKKVSENLKNEPTLENVCADLKKGDGSSFIDYLKFKDIVLSDGTYNEIKKYAELHDKLNVKKILLKYSGVRGSELEDILAVIDGDYIDYKEFKNAPETCSFSNAYMFHDDVNNRHLWVSPNYRSVKYCPKCFKKVRKIEIPCPNCGCDFRK